MRGDFRRGDDFERRCDSQLGGGGGVLREGVVFKEGQEKELGAAGGFLGNESQ